MVPDVAQLRVAANYRRDRAAATTVRNRNDENRASRNGRRVVGDGMFRSSIEISRDT
jgi:hypothetical protein